VDKKYESHKQLIFKEVWRASLLYSIAWDELLSVAHIAFLKTERNWKESRGKFSTLLVSIIRNEFKLYIRDMPPLSYEQQVERASLKYSPSKAITLEDTVSTLSKEAKHVINLFLDGPAEALGIKGYEPPKIIRSLLKRHLILERGWSHVTYHNAMNEVRQFVATIK
jgi:hypothetical protein